MISGGKMLVEALYRHGVRRVFCVAGESYLAALDALLDYPKIDVVTCRHESGASFMAESYANLTGLPGIVFVTRGPGACNASIGLHTARQSSAPVVMFVGLISRDHEGREAFQEFDMAQMFATHTKWSAVISAPEDIAKEVAKGFEVALSGRCGPVVLGLPEDILTGNAADSDVKPKAVSDVQPSAQDMEALRAMLAEAEKPLVIVGGHGWRDEACAKLAAFAGQAGLPVAASFRRQDVFDHNHESYVGELGFGSNPALLDYAREADLVIALGARISDVMTQGYSLFQKRQKIVHVYPDKAVFGKAYVPDLGIEAYPWQVVDALTGKVDGTGRKDWTAKGRANYEAWNRIEAQDAGWDGADMTQVLRQLRDMLPEDAIITTDAGNFSGWSNRYIRYARPMRQLAPLSGAMGYGVPAAVSASIAYPGRVVVGFCGDGGFMMTGQELATAMHHGAKPIIIVCNNNMYGTIRMHQERDFPGRISGTALTNPDFVKLAESYGAFGARVENAGDFAAAFGAALGAEKPALIEIKQDPRQITTIAKP